MELLKWHRVHYSSSGHHLLRDGAPQVLCTARSGRHCRIWIVRDTTISTSLCLIVRSRASQARHAFYLIRNIAFEMENEPSDRMWQIELYGCDVLWGYKTWTRRLTRHSTTKPNAVLIAFVASSRKSKFLTLLFRSGVVNRSSIRSLLR